MSKLTARHDDWSSQRPRLAAVKWSAPSTGPDTSAVDDSWAEAGSRHSYITYKGATEAPQPLAYDLWDSPRALLVFVDLPGVEAQYVSLNLGSQALYLRVMVPESVEPPPGLQPGQHELRLEAPFASGPDAIDASLSNGLLRIRVAKASDGSRRVAIVSSVDD